MTASRSRLVAAYFNTLPSVMRWHMVRTFFLFRGELMLACAPVRWLEANADFEKAPWGSFFGSDGDVDHLLAMGWTINALVKFYLRLAFVCAAAALAEYARNAWPERGPVRDGMRRLMSFSPSA